ncbi:hypothetical protein GCM10020295_26410 [Streptomyces cinereospinus]
MLIMTMITGVRVLTESGLSEPRDVTVEGAAIGAIAPASTDAANRTDADTVDGHGKVLLPGLIDTHIHLSGLSELEAMAAAGVTTAFDLGTHPASLVDELRGLPALTDLRSAGSAASAPGSGQSTVMGFPADSVVTSPEDAARYLSVRVAEGADLIKIIVEDPAKVPAALPVESISALVTGAHELGLLTVAHATTADAFRRAVTAGVDVITHTPLDRLLDPDVVALMLQQGTMVSPTLVMMRGGHRQRRR